MAATATSQKVASKLAVAIKNSGDISTPADTVFPEAGTWLDMSGYEHVLFIVNVTTAGGAVDVFTILGNTASDGTGTDYTVKSHALGSAPDAVNDYVILEASAEQLAGNRYCTVSVGTDNAAVRCAIIAIRTKGRFSNEDLSADNIA